MSFKLQFEGLLSKSQEELELTIPERSTAPSLYLSVPKVENVLSDNMLVFANKHPGLYIGTRNCWWQHINWPPVPTAWTRRLPLRDASPRVTFCLPCVNSVEWEMAWLVAFEHIRENNLSRADWMVQQSRWLVYGVNNLRKWQSGSRKEDRA